MDIFCRVGVSLYPLSLLQDNFLKLQSEIIKVVLNLKKVTECKAEHYNINHFRHYFSLIKDPKFPCIGHLCWEYI